MIHFNFYIRNPYVELFESVYLKSGLTPLKHKAYEFEIYRSSDILGFGTYFDINQSHAGFRLSLSLLTYSFDFSFYDVRHWDYENNKYYKIEEQ